MHCWYLRIFCIIGICTSLFREHCMYHRLNDYKFRWNRFLFALHAYTYVCFLASLDSTKAVQAGIVGYLVCLWWGKSSVSYKYIFLIKNTFLLLKAEGQYKRFTRTQNWKSTIQTKIKIETYHKSQKTLNHLINITKNKQIHVFK